MRRLQSLKYIEKIKEKCTEHGNNSFEKINNYENQIEKDQQESKEESEDSKAVSTVAPVVCTGCLAAFNVIKNRQPTCDL